jgi:hypothetical protein
MGPAYHGRASIDDYVVALWNFDMFLESKNMCKDTCTKKWTDTVWLDNVLSR